MRGHHEQWKLNDLIANFPFQIAIQRSVKFFDIVLRLKALHHVELDSFVYVFLSASYAFPQRTGCSGHVDLQIAIVVMLVMGWSALVVHMVVHFVIVYHDIAMVHELCLHDMGQAMILKSSRLILIPKAILDIEFDVAIAGRPTIALEGLLVQVLDLESRFAVVIFRLVEFATIQLIVLTKLLKIEGEILLGYHTRHSIDVDS